MGTELALTLLFGLLDRVAAINSLLQKAKAEGRDITEAELDALAAQDDVARSKLAAEIAKARGA